MSSSNDPTSPPSEGAEAPTIVYDPNDPFWRDTEDDDDDMDFQPAEGGSEDEEGDISFHGAHIRFLIFIEANPYRRCRTIEQS
jgi:WD repeat-containing protein 23